MLDSLPRGFQDGLKTVPNLLVRKALVHGDGRQRVVRNLVGHTFPRALWAWDAGFVPWPAAYVETHVPGRHIL